MVSVEFAAALPAVVFVLASTLAAVGLVIDQMRCVDAARGGARAAARGDASASVAAAARTLAPEGAAVSVGGGPDSVTVTVRASGGAWSRWLPDALEPRATARTPRELATARTPRELATARTSGEPATEPGDNGTGALSPVDRPISSRVRAPAAANGVEDR